MDKVKAEPKTEEQVSLAIANNTTDPISKVTVATNIAISGPKRAAHAKLRELAARMADEASG